MRDPLKKIIAVFIVVALLPVSFVIYEVTSLNRNETMVREIYQNQLEAILYSVNQYSDDIISSWANRINTTLVQHAGTTWPDSTALLSVLGQMSAVRYLYFSDLKGSSIVYGTQGNAGLKKKVQQVTDGVIKHERRRVRKLIGYQQAGFRKMEAIDTTITGNDMPVFFVFDRGGAEQGLGVMVIDLPVFIQNILGPKMQAISQEKFVISALQQRNDVLVYSTGPPGGGGDVVAARGEAVPAGDGVNDEWQKKAFWLLPGYYLAISLKGATIDDLAKERVTTSAVILFLLMLSLTAGMVFLYRNIRRELYLSQAKSEFVSNVSHEIRTPLSLISMYAETLEMNRVPEEKKREYYGVIAKETTRLSRIVNRILNFSQVEANKKNYHFKPIQLNDLCAEIMDSYFFQLRDKGFTCEMIRKEDLPVIVGDRDSIAEALINLVDNAIKYSRDDKRIVITTGNDAQYTYVEVRDYGIGIARNHQPEIFDQFYRAPIGDVHTTKGSGLGLTLVKKTMEAHHGKVKVESAPAKGSTFRLYFVNKKPEL